MRLREGLRSNRRCDVSVLARIMEDYAFLCIYASRRNALNSADPDVGIGPVDPWLARDLAAAAARNPKTTWCVTVTDGQRHAVGHGCARPQPKSHRNRDGPGFAFTAADRHDPPGGYGTWRLRVGGEELTVIIDPVTTEECDHRFQAKGHDPGVKLRHLAQV